MPRELKQSKNLPLLISDPQKGEKVTVYLEEPSTDGKIAYGSAYMNVLINDKGSKENRVKDLLENQIAWGKKYLKGVEPGYFTYDGIPISSNPEDTKEVYDSALKEYEKDGSKKSELKIKGIYNPGWKEIIEEGWPELYSAIVEYLFGLKPSVIKEESHPFMMN